MSLACGGKMALFPIPTPCKYGRDRKKEILGRSLEVKSDEETMRRTHWNAFSQPSQYGPLIRGLSARGTDCIVDVRITECQV
jgi:hypothetical protein